MSLTFKTDNPQALLDAFNKAIDQKEPKGKINTWFRTDSGAYTHLAKDWTRKAFFRADIVEDVGLRFRMTPPEGKIIEPLVYAYFHGHLTETFINHFPKMFERATSTARPSTSDKMKASGL